MGMALKIGFWLFTQILGMVFIGHDGENNKPKKFVAFIDFWPKDRALNLRDIYLLGPNI